MAEGSREALRAARPSPAWRSLHVARTLRLLAYQAVFGLGILGLWEYAADRWISSFWISSPSQIAGHLATIARNGELFADLSVTLYEAFVGFVIGGVLGVAAGIALAQSGTAAYVLQPYLRAFYGIPRIALAPLFIIWFGIGIESKVMLVVLVVFFLTFSSAFAGAKSVPPGFVDTMRILGGSRWQTAVKVMLPATVPWILNGLEMSLPYAIVAAVTGEFIAANRGIGYMIALNSNLFFTTGAMTGIVVLALVVLVANSVIGWIGARLLRWRPQQPRESGTREMY